MGILPQSTSDFSVTFKAIFEFIGKSLSLVFNFKGYELEKNEIELLSTQSNDVTIEFFPNVQGKWVKLGIFVTSILSIFGKKYLDHQISIKKDKPKKENNPQPENKPVEQELSIVKTYPVNPNKMF